MTEKLTEAHFQLATLIREKCLPNLCAHMMQRMERTGLTPDYIHEFLKVAMPDHVYGKMVLDGALEGIGMDAPAVFASVEALAKIGAWAKLPEDVRGPSPLSDMLHFMTAAGDIVPAEALDMDAAATHVGSRMQS